MTYITVTVDFKVWNDFRNKEVSFYEKSCPRFGIVWFSYIFNGDIQLNDRVNISFKDEKSMLAWKIKYG